MHSPGESVDSPELHIRSDLRLGLRLGVVGVDGAACAAQSTGLVFGCKRLDVIDAEVDVDVDGDLGPKCLS